MGTRKNERDRETPEGRGLRAGDDFHSKAEVGTNLVNGGMPLEPFTYNKLDLVYTIISGVL